MAAKGSVLLEVGQKPAVNEASDANVTCNSHVNPTLGEEIVRNGLISRLILSHLDARSICRSKTTCREWKDEAAKILSRRKNIQFLCYAYDFTASLSNQADVKPAAALLHSHGLLGTNSGMMINFLRQCLKDHQWSKPSFGLLFHGGVKTVPSSVKPLVKNLLPADCQLIALASSSGFIPGVVDKDTKSFTSTEIQGRGQLIAGMSYLLCPDLGFEVTTFDENSSLEEFKPEEDGSHKKLKALLVFSTEYMKRIGRREVYVSFDRVNEIFEDYDRKIALGGVVVDNIQVFPGAAKKLSSSSRATPSYAKDFCGFAVSGDNVKAASGIFDMESLESLEQELKDFRASLDFDPDEQSSRCKTFGFLFTCSGRGPAMFKNAPNAEVGVINRVFPFVVFNGIFGDGEFGENYWPKVMSGEAENSHLIGHGVHSKVTEDEETKFWHFYSNVIVLIHVTLDSSSN